MRAVRQFNVVPAIPAPLQALAEVASNLHWTWDRDTQALFERLDPAAVEGHRARPPAPVGRHHRHAGGPSSPPIPTVVAATEAAADRLRDAIEAPRWFQSRDRLAARARRLLLPRVRHLRDAAAVLRRPRRPRRRPPEGRLRPRACRWSAVGLLYAEGYFRQRLNADGVQEERYPPLDPHGLALHPTGVQVSVDLAGEHVRINVWQRGGGPHPAVPARHQRRGQQPRGRRRHRPSVRRRQGAPPAPGDGAGHRRRARPARPRATTRRCSTPTRATPASCRSSASASWSPPRASRSPTPSRPCAPAACSPPTPPCRPASTSSPAS